MLRAPDAGTRRSFNECLQQGSAQIQGWLGLAGREKTSHPDDLAALSQAANSTLVLLSSIDVADRSLDAPLPGVLREYIAKTMEQMAAILLTGRYPVDIAWQSPDDDPLHLPDPLLLLERAGPFGDAALVEPLYVREPDATVQA